MRDEKRGPPVKLKDPSDRRGNKLPRQPPIQPLSRVPNKNIRGKKTKEGGTFSKLKDIGSEAAVRAATAISHQLHLGVLLLFDVVLALALHLISFDRDPILAFVLWAVAIISGSATIAAAIWKFSNRPFKALLIRFASNLGRRDSGK